MAELQRNARARRFHIEEPSQPLTHIEDLGVKLEVARSMQRQYGFWDVVRRGELMEQEILFSVYDVCMTDPAHKRKAVNGTPAQIMEGVSDASMRARADQLEAELNDPFMTKEVGLPALDELARLYNKLEG